MFVDGSYNGIQYNIADLGGPFYIEVGRYIDIAATDMIDQKIAGRRLETAIPDDKSTVQGYTFYDFTPSAVEFYHYK